MKLNKLLKLILYDNYKVIVENYNELKEITNEKIIIDCYFIFGQNLKIVTIDEFLIQINGKINNIEYISDSK